MNKKQTHILSHQEMELIAGLTQNQGYTMLCDRIQAFIDDVSDDIALAKTREQERRHLALWRALRKVHALLISTPAEMVEELRGDLGMEKDDTITKLRVPPSTWAPTTGPATSYGANYPYNVPNPYLVGTPQWPANVPIPSNLPNAGYNPGYYPQGQQFSSAWNLPKQPDNNS